MFKRAPEDTVYHDIYKDKLRGKSEALVINELDSLNAINDSHKVNIN